MAQYSTTTKFKLFLSTPSGWRATSFGISASKSIVISIHALRVEGDKGGGWLSWVRFDFYPRPPGGGRLSTPGLLPFSQNFYPRPPGGGRLFSASTAILMPAKISIHALRVEGDPLEFANPPLLTYAFLSTPSGWRATRAICPAWTAQSANFYPRPPGGGRRGGIDTILPQADFYPRPPGGGRRPRISPKRRRHSFLSTPSGWRATDTIVGQQQEIKISIHALRVEGDCSPLTAYSKDT